MRYLLLILLTIPCSLDASVITQQQIREYDEWLYLVTFGAPCTTRMDEAEQTCNLKVRRKPPIRQKVKKHGKR